MNNLFGTTRARALALALGSALAAGAAAVPLQAQDASEDEQNIVVQPSMARFADTVGQHLDRQLARGNYPANSSGIVRINFVANGAGTAENVTLFEGSGDARIDHAAMRAVDRLANLATSPLAEDGRQEVLATIVYAQSTSEAEWLMRRAARENDAIMAAGRVAPHVLAITVLPGSRS